MNGLVNQQRDDEELRELALFAGAGGGILGGICSDGERSVLSNSTPMPDQFYWPDKTTEHSRLSRFGMTSEPLTANLGAELLMWYLAGFHARTSVGPALGLVLTASEAGSGPSSAGLLATFDLATSTWKTVQCSLLEDSDEFLETWPRWGSMRNGESFQRPIPALPICANESGSWPTPTVCGNYNRKGASATSGDGLATAVRKWPTPCASACKGSSPGALTRKSGASRANDRIDHAVMASDGGQLNPEWVEWLMGWPVGWTELKPLEMAKFHEWRQQHGKSWAHDAVKQQYWG